jgi:lysozyme
MTTRQRVSRSGIDFIKRFEGFRARAARLPDGRYVVGYGHEQTAREGVVVDEADAHALLVYDLKAVESALHEWVFTPLNQNQFDALASFVFSIGLNSFRRSDVLRRLNEGALLQAAGVLEMWRQADLDGELVVIDALVRRRAAEKALFLTPLEGFRPASSIVLRPRLDLSAHLAVLRGDAEDVVVLLEGDEAVVARAGPSEAELEAAAVVAAAAAMAAGPVLYAELADDEPAEAEPEAEPDFTQLEQTPDEDAGVAEATPQATAPDAVEAQHAEARGPGEPDLVAPAAEAPVDGGAEPGEAEPLVAEPDLTLAGPDADEDWSAARAAAAAVTARLHEILRGDFNEGEDATAPEPSHPSPAGEPPAAGSVAPMTAVESPAEPLEPAQPAEAAASADTLPELEPFPIAREGAAADEPAARGLEPFPTTIAAAEPEPAQPVDLGAFEPLPAAPIAAQPAERPAGDAEGAGPFVMLGLVGLLFIIAALVSLFRPAAPGEAVEGLSWVSLTLGLIGIGGVVGALWFTLGREDAAHEPD